MYIYIYKVCYKSVMVYVHSEIIDVLCDENENNCKKEM